MERKLVDDAKVQEFRKIMIKAIIDVVGNSKEDEINRRMNNIFYVNYNYETTKEEASLLTDGLIKQLRESMNVSDEMSDSIHQVIDPYISSGGKDSGTFGFADDNGQQYSIILFNNEDYEWIRKYVHEHIHCLSPFKEDGERGILAQQVLLNEYFTEKVALEVLNKLEQKYDLNVFNSEEDRKVVMMYRAPDQQLGVLFEEDKENIIEAYVNSDMDYLKGILGVDLIDELEEFCGRVVKYVYTFTMEVTEEREKGFEKVLQDRDILKDKVLAVVDEKIRNK